MAGIGDEGQRMGPDAVDDFGHDKRAVQSDSDRESEADSRGGVTVSNALVIVIQAAPIVFKTDIVAPYA